MTPGYGIELIVFLVVFGTVWFVGSTITRWSRREGKQ